MNLPLDHDYIRSRIERNKNLANEASMPELRSIHLAHMEHYQKMLDMVQQGRRAV